MKGWIKLALAAGAAAVAGHLLMTGMIPRAIMSVAMNRIAEQAGGWNKLSHSPLVTPQNQRIVRSSPDLAYSTCALDLAQGPVRLVIHPAGTYTSVAVYAANTDTRFVLNDRQMGQGPARLLVVGPRSPVAAQPGETTVSLPSARGLVLVRRLAPNGEAFAVVEGARRQDICQHVK